MVFLRGKKTLTRSIVFLENDNVQVLTCLESFVAETQHSVLLSQIEWCCRHLRPKKVR